MKKIIGKTHRFVTKQVEVRMPPGSFGHKVFIMLTGTVAGQAISVALAPILTRIYTPEEFGILGSFSSLLTILAVIAILRYELALPLTKNKKEENNLVALCFLILSILTVFLTISIATLWTKEGWNRFFIFPYEYRWLLPIGFFSVAAYQIMVYLATKKGDFKTLAKTKLYQGTAGPLTQIGLGLSGVGMLGLIIGFIVGQSTGISILFSKLVIKTGALKDEISWAGMKEVAIRFRHFPIISTWSALIGISSSNTALLFILPILYSPTIAGFVFITERVIVRPLMLITTSIMQVYIGDIANSLRDDTRHISKRFLRLSRQQVIISGGWLILVNVAAPFVFPIVFGAKWGAAVPYLHVLSLAYFGQMFIQPLFQSLQAMELHGRVFAWEFFNAILVVSVFYISFILDLEPLNGLLLYSICKFMAYIILYMIIYYSICNIKSLPKQS